MLTTEQNYGKTFIINILHQYYVKYLSLDSSAYSNLTTIVHIFNVSFAL